jgi:hypothetical protein
MFHMSQQIAGIKPSIELLHKASDKSPGNNVTEGRHRKFCGKKSKKLVRSGVEVTVVRMFVHQTVEWELSDEQ